MKVLDYIKQMSKKHKIIWLSSISTVLIMAVCITVIVSNNSKTAETYSSKNANLELVKEDLNKDKKINLVEAPIEEAVVVQESEEVSEEQLEQEKVQPEETKTGTAPYYIKVNYGANTVTVYGKDEEENYTVPVKAMVCSCGRATPTSGVYKTKEGYKWGTLIGGVYGQYSTRIVGSILFHSVPYTAQSPDSLEYWEFDKLGTTASAGCVRLMVSDAQWIYYNCRGGTMVEFYSDSNPGPLGKPSAPKISGNERCRDWDPTDPAEGNPWRDEVVEETTNEEVQEIVEQPVQGQIAQPEPASVETKPAQPQATPNPSNQSKKENVVPKQEEETVNNTINQTVENTTISTNTTTDTPTNTVENTSSENENQTSNQVQNQTGGENPDQQEENENNENTGNSGETGSQEPPEGNG